MTNAARALLLILCLLVSLVALAGWGALRLIDQQGDQRSLVLHTYDVLDNARTLLSAVQDAETGQRGFLLTQRATYLSPYEAAVATIPGLLASLQERVADSPAQVRRVVQTQGLVQTKLTELADTIRLAREQGPAAAQQLVQNDVGRNAMERIGGLIREVVVEEQALLADRIGSAQRTQERATMVTLFGALTGVIGLAIAASLLLRSAFRLRRADRALAQQAGVLQATLDGTHDGIAAFDAERRLLAWNARFFRLLGLPEDRARRGTPVELLAGDSAAAPVSVLSLLAPIDGGVRPESATRRLTIGERELELHYGTLAGAGELVAVSDVTARVRSDEVLRRAQRMEAIGQLTGGVAHDFNNLLQVVAGNLDMIRSEELSSRGERRLQTAFAGVERATKLTGQLLAFARRQPLDPVSVNPARLVGDMAEMLQRTLGEEIQIESVVAGGLWNALVDPSQLENAILNLAINARDAMPDGGRLTIELGNVALDDDYAAAHVEVLAGQYVMVAVADTGSGIPAELIARVFDPFFSTKEEGRGTGLGLSQVYGFVKQSGGHVKIYSESGHGTTVKLYLPRSHRAEELLQRDDRTEPRGQGERVLVVEDDAQVRATVTELLQELGYRVRATTDAESALEVLRSEPVDLLFTDVVMPGPIPTREMAATAERLQPGIAVLFTSGYTENSVIHHGRLDPGVALLSKPYRRDQLARKLRAVLDAVPVAVEVPATSG